MTTDLASAGGSLVDLLDVTDISIGDLLRPSDTTALGEALRRATKTAAKAGQGDAVSAFNSAI